ncbi:hypothetical protein HYS79_00580 [Patescibacteria group bacterium]|nr:hypothetical protein [Patescibacteria group bacterium]
MRFGFETGEGKTLQEIGEKMGLSPSRVAQIEHEALRKLKGGAGYRNLLMAGLKEVRRSGYRTLRPDDEVLKAL